MWVRKGRGEEDGGEGAGLSARVHARLSEGALSGHSDCAIVKGGEAVQKFAEKKVDLMEWETGYAQLRHDHPIFSAEAILWEEGQLVIGSWDRRCSCRYGDSGFHSRLDILLGEMAVGTWQSWGWWWLSEKRSCFESMCSLTAKCGGYYNYVFSKNVFLFQILSGWPYVRDKMKKFFFV